MKNKINIQNYEAFLLDYMEGNLSSEDTVALQIFAAQHPDLNIDLNDLELVELSTDEISFDSKENLKKNLISDEQFVAYIENELNPAERNRLDALVAKDEKLARELKLFKHTLLSSDKAIVFKNKNSLKKQEPKVLWLFSREVLAAAASLVLLFGLWFVFKGSLTSGDLNSEKIRGTINIKTFALKNYISSTPTFTVEKTKHDLIISGNPIAYSTKKNVKENENPKEEKSLLVNTIKENTPNTPKEIIPEAKKDNKIDNTTKLASNTTSTIQSYVITEKAFDEDEKTSVASNPKKGFWNRAMKTLNGLNKLGVKKAKGTETVEQNNEQYVLTMGNFKVENHKYNAE